LGLTFHRLIPPASLAWGATDQWFSETIDGLPGPLGIFAFQDRDAAFLRETCLRCGIDVPNRVGLLGVDDDIRVCTDIAPELSSVRVPWREIGWQLALTCQGLWEGNQPSERRRRVSAYGVHRRGSTDLASRQPGDDLVRRFLTAARRAALRGKGVRDLLPRLGVSQPTLYRRVTAALGRSPSKLILDFRTDKACQLLRESDLSLAGVAQRSGFSNERSLYGAFTARYPVSPGEWRKG
jgi:LacI family transcriptional regulator